MIFVKLIHSSYFLTLFMFIASSIESQTPKMIGSKDETRAKTIIKVSSSNLDQPKVDKENKDKKKKSEPALTKIYFDSGNRFLTSGSKKKALEQFEKASTEGDDIFANRARIMMIELKAQAGKNIDKDIEFLEDDWKPAGFKAASLGYHHRNKTKMNYYLNQLLKNHPNSREALESIPIIARMYIDNKKYAAAMSALLTVFVKEGDKYKLFNGETPQDEMWYLLARIFDESKEFYDPYRANIAFEKVLEKPNSNYAEYARRRSRELIHLYKIK